MVTNKIFLWIIASLLTGAFCAVTAMAETKHSEAYEGLTAVHLAPGQAPRLLNGVADLSTTEHRHGERLPMQLEGAIKKIKKAKYSPRAVSRERPTNF